MKLWIFILLIALLTGCAQDQPVPVQPVAIAAKDFCATMKAVLPPTGKPTWDVVDSRQTITDARKVGAAVDRNCKP